MNLPTIRTLDVNELDRVYDIDRSESVERKYRQSGDGLEEYEDNDFFASDPEFWDLHLDDWKREMLQGAPCFGSFNGENLTGFAILKHDAIPGGDQILALYVSSEYRLSGIAKTLYLEMQDSAKENRAKGLYVVTPPTGSAVGFYLSQGFSTAPAEIHDLFTPSKDELVLSKAIG